MSLAELVWNRYRRELIETLFVAGVVVLAHAVWSRADFDAAARGFWRMTNSDRNPDPSLERRLSKLEPLFATDDADSAFSDSASSWKRLSTGRNVWILETKGDWVAIMERLGKLEVRSRKVVVDSVVLEWKAESVPLDLVVGARRLP